MEIAILTPLQDDLPFLLVGLEKFGLGRRETKLGRMDIFEFSEANLLVAHGGHGKTQFGIQSQYLLCQEPQI
jgi:adenosylhomocysteine nucleosidase